MATSARLEELQEKFNENPRRYFAPLANEHRKLGDLAQAIALCRSHLPQQPQHVSGHIVLAQALFEAGEVADARGTFEMALDLDPENLIALRYLGDIARTEGDRHGARQWYSRVLDADPRNDDIALLIRELEAPEPAAPSPDPLAPDFAQEQPNESPEPVVGFEATQDLANAWQHDVDAQANASVGAPVDASQPWMDLVPTSAPAEAAPLNEVLGADWQPAEVASEGPVAEPEPLDLPSFDASVDEEAPPDEPWAPTPSAETPAEPMDVVKEEAPAAFAEIDYSMFEAVADEETLAVEEPVLAAEPDPEGSLATEQEVPAESEPVAQGVIEADAPVADRQTASPDDWFAAASAEHDLTPDGADPAFDLDAAFQSVLPNQRVEETEPVPPAEEPQWLPEPAAEEALAESDADFETAALSSEVAEPSMNSLWEPDTSVADFEAPTSDAGEMTDLLSEVAPPAAEWEEEPAATIDDAMTADADDASWSLDMQSSDMELRSEGADAEEVDSAFAELDRLTGAMQDDLAANTMLLPDEDYAASPNAMDDTYSPSEPTPEDGVAAVEETEGAFVTETMAELYLQQGFRDEALAVYRQLVERYPDDAVLAERVRALEGNAEPETAALRHAALAAPHADVLGQSVRAFLGVFARRRAPMRRRAPAVEAPAAPAAESTPLGALFDAPADADDRSAAVLAGAFAEPNGVTATLPGRPTRAADAELKLGDVFRSTPPAGAAHSASFDEFFSTGSSESAPSPLDDQGSDMEQFTAWLEGLKKK